MSVTIGEFEQQIAALMGISADDINAWMVTVHDKRHGFGFIHSRESAEHPGTDRVPLQMLVAALHDLVATRFMDEEPSK